MPPPTRLSVILLVDDRGRLLLQERDEHAPRAAGQWGLVGGHVEDGEDFETAAYRELAEETGIRLTGGLRLWRDEEFRYSDMDSPLHYQVWVAPTTLTDADIVVGEGRQIVFLPPEQVAELDRSESCAHFTAALLGSGTYRSLEKEAARSRRPGLTVLPVPGYGAEDVLVGPDDSVYTGTDDGSVFRVRPDGDRIDRVGHTGGRPLGLENLPDGRILVCDAERGLLALDPASGRIDVLTAFVHGQRLGVCNNAAVHSSGDIYFSDSSRVFPLDHWRADLTENTATGRLLRRAPDGAVEVVLEGLRFANGVALAADESFVAVAETGGRTVVRRWLSGPRTGQVDRLAEDLPGYPDNISTGTDGLIWVAVAAPPLALLERLMTAPRPVRRVAWRVPPALQPAPARSVRVMAFDDAGRVVHDLGAEASGFHMVTGVREHHGAVWIGSLEESAIAVLHVSSAREASSDAQPVKQWRA
jgi:sugar lactone lactonase YvrE/8-oxo-dGTP pyrophosphatase MutT (NUDIX family)